MLITGGEPLAQEGTLELTQRLLDRGSIVVLETSGAKSIEGIDARVRIILDIKCPGSGMHDKMYWPNLERLRPLDEVKFVVTDREDYEFAVHIMRSQKLEDQRSILLSPVSGKLDPQTVALWMLRDKLRARLQVQLHVIAWPDLL